jgi:outer membrane biosynthesis protein TonB
MLDVIVLALALQAAAAGPRAAAPPPAAQGPTTGAELADPDRISHRAGSICRNGGDMASTYPARAMAAGVSGGAVIKCEVLGVRPWTVPVRWMRR